MEDVDRDHRDDNWDTIKRICKGSEKELVRFRVVNVLKRVWLVMIALSQPP